VIGNLFEFEDDGPKWISLSPKINSQGPCVRTLEVEKGGFPPVEFSGDSLKAASISRTAIEILDVSMEQCLQEVECRPKYGRSLAFCQTQRSFCHSDSPEILSISGIRLEVNSYWRSNSIAHPSTGLDRPSFHTTRR
jgi:hypothetical protein